MTGAERFHAYYAAQTVVTEVNVSRKGKTYTGARMADGTNAYRIDGGRWTDHWSVDASAGTLFCSSEIDPRLEG